MCRVFRLFIGVGVILHGVGAKVLDCDFIVSEFELQFGYLVLFLTYTLGKGMKPLIPSSYGLDSTTTVQQEWHWH